MNENLYNRDFINKGSASRYAPFIQLEGYNMKTKVNKEETHTYIKELYNVYY